MEDTNPNPDPPATGELPRPLPRPIKVPKSRLTAPRQQQAGQSSSQALPYTNTLLPSPTPIQIQSHVPQPQPQSQSQSQPQTQTQTQTQLQLPVADQEFRFDARGQFNPNTLGDCQAELHKAIAANDLLVAEKSTSWDAKEAAEADVKAWMKDCNEAHGRIIFLNTMIERLEDALEAAGIDVPEEEGSVESDEDEDDYDAVKEPLSEAASDAAASSNESKEPYAAEDEGTQTDFETAEVIQIRNMEREIQELEAQNKELRKQVQKLEFTTNNDQDYVKATETQASEFKEALNKQNLLTAKLKQDILDHKAQKKMDDDHINDIQTQLVAALEQNELDAKDIKKFKTWDEQKNAEIVTHKNDADYWKNEVLKSAQQQKEILNKEAQYFKEVKGQKDEIDSLGNQILESAHFAPDLFKHQSILENTLRQINGVMDDVPPFQLHPEAYEAPSFVAPANLSLEEELAAFSSVDSSTGGFNGGHGDGSGGSSTFAFDEMKESFSDEEDPYRIHEPLTEESEDESDMSLLVEDDEDEDEEENNSTIHVDPVSIENVLLQAVVKEVVVQVPVVNEVEVPAGNEAESRRGSSHSQLSERLDELFGGPDHIPNPGPKRNRSLDAGPYEQPVAPDPVIVYLPGIVPDPVIITIPGPAPPPEIVVQERLVHSWFFVERDTAYLLLTFLYATIITTFPQWFIQEVRGVAPITSNPTTVPEDNQDPEGSGGLEESQDDTILPQAQMMTVVRPAGPASSAPTGRLALGSDPEDAPFRPVTPPFVDFSMLPPLPVSPDTREEIPLAPPASPPVNNIDEPQVTPATAPTDTGAPPPPPAAPILTTAPEFWDIFADRPRPSIFWTLLLMLLHLVVYYFIYVSFSTYQERNLWLAANDATRAYLHTIMGFRYNNGFLRKVISDTWATQIERIIFIAITSLAPMQVQAFKMPG